MNRLVEVYALTKWADDQRRSKTTHDKDIILIGDKSLQIMPVDLRYYFLHTAKTKTNFNFNTIVINASNTIELN
jgi:hypothetical protein